jgi:hypothetical protein
MAPLAEPLWKGATRRSEVATQPRRVAVRCAGWLGGGLGRGDQAEGLDVVGEGAEDSDAEFALAAEGHGVRS